MNGKFILRPDGIAIPEPDLYTWAMWFENNCRIIARYEHGGVVVSTVFLGLDHRWGGGPPLLFETMIIGGPHNGDQWRYSTQAESKEGHIAAVQLVRPKKVKG